MTSPLSHIKVIEISVAMAGPYCGMFGGDDLDILYVTSGHIFLSAEEKAAQPLAGSLFAVHGLGVRSIPEPFFAG